MSAIDVDAWLGASAPRTDEVTVCNRGDLVDRHAELVAAMQQASSGTRSLGGNSEANSLAEQIVALEEEMAGSILTVKLQSIGGEWADLLAKHPPRKTDTGQDHNPETFPPVAVAACSVEPKLTPEQAAGMKARLTVGEWNKLWLSAVALNVIGMPRPKLAAATELLRANGRSSGSPAGPGSLGPSSLAGSGDPSPSTTTETTGG